MPLLRAFLSPVQQGIKATAKMAMEAQVQRGRGSVFVLLYPTTASLLLCVLQFFKSIKCCNLCVLQFLELL